MIEIYCVKLIEKNDDLYYNLLTLVDNVKKKQIISYLNWQDSYRTLFGDILIRSIICNKLKIQNNEILFSINEYGKPFLTSYKNFHFNISHSGAWISCLINTSPVGIDIEKIKTIDSDKMEHYFSKLEYAELSKKSETKKLLYFYDLWTLKESYIKALGRGLSISLNSFSIILNNNNIIAQTDNGVIENIFFRQYHIDSNYKFSICAFDKLFPNFVSIVDICDIYKILSNSLA